MNINRAQYRKGLRNTFYRKLYRKLFKRTAPYGKLNGKPVIHMGGATQILFGVRAKRWENNAQISCYFNENWVYPNENEKPKNASRVEGGCYW
jgi:hypothetical protein